MVRYCQLHWVICFEKINRISMKPIPYTVCGHPRDLDFIASELIDVPAADPSVGLIPLGSWCAEHASGRWSHEFLKHGPAGPTIRFYFGLAEDAVAFKLRWSDEWAR